MMSEATCRVCGTLCEAVDLHVDLECCPDCTAQHACLHEDEGPCAPCRRMADRDEAAHRAPMLAVWAEDLSEVLW